MLTPHGEGSCDGNGVKVRTAYLGGGSSRDGVPAFGGGTSRYILAVSKRHEEFPAFVTCTAERFKRLLGFRGDIHLPLREERNYFSADGVDFFAD